MAEEQTQEDSDAVERAAEQAAARAAARATAADRLELATAHFEGNPLGGTEVELYDAARQALEAQGYQMIVSIDAKRWLEQGGLAGITSRARDLVKELRAEPVAQ